MNTEEDSLIIFERAAMMLAEADTVQKCKAGKDLCATAERYAKARRLSEESIQHARSYALEFERKLGEMLKEKPNPSREHGGPGRGKKGRESDSPPFSDPTLVELGVTKNESKTAQAVADLPDETFQAVKAGTISKKAAIRQNKMVGSGNGDHPKGSTKKPRKAPKPHPQRDEMISLSDNGLSDAQISAKIGISTHTIRREVEREKIVREVEPTITPNMLSMTAQQKLELAIKQHKEKLTVEWRIAVSARVDELLANTIGPQLKKEQDEARWVMKSRKGIMNRKEYGKILACLHPDRVDPELKERYADAFRLFTKIEKLLLNENESPTEYVLTPTVGTDWEELKRQASAARKAKRAANKSNKGGIRPQ